MSETAWIRSHVERLLQEEWGVARLEPDGHGDYFFRHGTAACWVSIIATAPVMVRVWAEAAYGLRPSLELFAELNEIERRALSTSVVLEDGAVVIAQTISPVGLTSPVLAQALLAVSGVADAVGLLLAGVFGGRTPFPASSEPVNEDAP